MKYSDSSENINLYTPKPDRSDKDFHRQVFKTLKFDSLEEKEKLLLTFKFINPYNILNNISRIYYSDYDARRNAQQ
ncbi:unnamed protein product [Paramecium sonneborni]|uniref:Uncharacterized protein n=1 Tax=Paramecium sonneborni TaxID=65129 RepID=A0A8S1RBL0_9CILI|nr:unnamed protein product [Paramecium sonneborni]